MIKKMPPCFCKGGILNYRYLKLPAKIILDTDNIIFI